MNLYFTYDAIVVQLVIVPPTVCSVLHVRYGVTVLRIYCAYVFIEDIFCNNEKTTPKNESDASPPHAHRNKSIVS